MSTAVRTAFLCFLVQIIALVIQIIHKCQRIYIFFLNSASALPSSHSDSKSSTQLQWYQPAIISLFRQRKFRQWFWKRARSSIDTFQAASEEKATAHDLFAHWGVGAGTSIQAAAIFDEWRWGGPSTETGDHSSTNDCIYLTVFLLKK